MNLSVIKLQSHSIQFFAQCPVVNERVAVYDSQEIDLTDQQATWWRCTICGGWHICLKKITFEEVETVKVVKAA